MARTKSTTELTVEEQIAKIQKEAQDKIKELRNSLSWHERFKTAFNEYLKHNSGDIAANLQGHKPEYGIERGINIALTDVNLKVSYDSSTFDNDLYNQGQMDNLVDSYDLSEYPVYTVFAVYEGTEVKGYVRINCHYSSYNGNEYSAWHFVKPQEITCKVFSAYKP